MATNEGAYRDGYHDGWIEAVNAIGALMFDRRLTRDQAHQRVFDFWQEELARWKQTDMGKRIPPPRCEEAS